MQNYEYLKNQYPRLAASGASPDRIMSLLGPDDVSLLRQHYSDDDLASSALAALEGIGTGAGAGAGASTGAGMGTKAGKAKGRFFKEGGFFGKNSGFSSALSNIGNPQFDYAWKSTVDPTTGKRVTGVQGWGKNLGGMYNIGNAAVQGFRAAEGLQDMSKVRSDSKDLVSDIVLSAANSPTIWHDLNADQRDLLRELQRDGYESKASLGDIDLLGALGNTVSGALAGLPGGLQGAIIGGVGGLTNSVIGDLGSAAGRDAAELEALYQAVLESENYHNQMRRQRAYSALY